MWTGLGLIAASKGRAFLKAWGPKIGMGLAAGGVLGALNWRGNTAMGGVGNVAKGAIMGGVLGGIGGGAGLLLASRAAGGALNSLALAGAKTWATKGAMIGGGFGLFKAGLGSNKARNPIRGLA
jgi:hypothetical protein